jgi:hypothetical protein
VSLEKILCLGSRADRNGVEASLVKQVAKDIPEVVRILDHHNVGHDSSLRHFFAAYKYATLPPRRFNSLGQRVDRATRHYLAASFAVNSGQLGISFVRCRFC